VADLVTRGIGKVERTADRAHVDVTFEALGTDRNEAVNRLTEKVSSVEPELSRDGVEVRSRALSVHDNWDGTQRAGSRASQRYVVRIDDLDQLDPVLAALLLAEPAWLNGPNWELADDAEAVREAQLQAVADARRRAEGYADALGGRIGPLTRLADGDSDMWPTENPSVRSLSYGAAEAVAPPVDQLNLQAQQITVSVRCTTAWSLLD
jgi:uncharacterized protein YggE